MSGKGFRLEQAETVRAMLVTKSMTEVRRMTLVLILRIMRRAFDIAKFFALRVASSMLLWLGPTDAWFYQTSYDVAPHLYTVV